MLFRLDSDQSQTSNAEESLSVLRVDNLGKGEIFQSWPQFKWVLKNNPADIIYRHLYYQRDF